MYLLGFTLGRYSGSFGLSVTSGLRRFRNSIVSFEHNSASPSSISETLDSPQSPGKVNPMNLKY